MLIGIRFSLAPHNLCARTDHHSWDRVGGILICAVTSTDEPVANPSFSPVSESSATSYCRGMGAPRYQPKNYCDRPKNFGKSSEVRFEPLSLANSDVPCSVAERRRRLDTSAYAHAALLQHEYAFAIRHILKVRKLTQVAYAQLVGEDTRRIGGMLRGEIVMRPDDVGRADLALGGVYFLVRRNQRLKWMRHAQSILDEINREDELARREADAP